MGSLQGNFNQIQNLMKIPVNSATLPVSQRLEQVLLSAESESDSADFGCLHGLSTGRSRQPPPRRRRS